MCNFRNELDPDNPQHDTYAAQLVNSLIQELESKATAGDNFIVRLKLSEAANDFRVISLIILLNLFFCIVKLYSKIINIKECNFFARKNVEPLPNMKQQKIKCFVIIVNFKYYFRMAMPPGKHMQFEIFAKEHGKCRQLQNFFKNTGKCVFLILSNKKYCCNF